MDTVTLSGTYHLPDGTPARGIIEIIPSVKQIVDDAGNVILSGRVKVSLDEAGHFSVDLPATDDATLTPTGFGYTLAAKLTHTHLPAVSFPLPAAEVAVDVSDVTEVDPASFTPTLSGYVTDAELAAALEDLPTGGGGAVDSVNAQTGAVVLDAADVGAEPAGTVATHAADTTDVHGIADTSALVLDDDPRLSDARTPSAHTHDDRYYTETETDSLLGAKANTSALTAHTTDTANPHAVTKAQVGLANVDNTSDANKPVSTAQAAADTAIGAAAATDATTKANAAQAAAVQRANHTGSQAIGTVTGLQAALDSAAAPHPAIMPRAGLYVAPPHVFANGALTLNDLYLTPWIVPTATFDSVLLNVSSAGAAGSVIRLGVYADSNGIPGARIAEWGTVDTATTGDKALSISWAPTAGRYWLAAVVQTAACSTRCNSGNANAASYSLAAPITLPGTVLAYAQAGVTGALPANVTLPSSGDYGGRYNPPRLYLRSAA